MAGAVAERASGGPQPACSVVQDPCRMPGRSDLFPFFFCRSTGIAWFWLDETAVFSCPFLESLLPVSCPGQEHHDDSCRLFCSTPPATRFPHRRCIVTLVLAGSDQVTSLMQYWFRFPERGIHGYLNARYITLPRENGSERAPP